MEIPNCFYRISIKALILSEARDKFLLCRENDGRWDFPGGGLDWDMTPHQDLPREIMEEMGLKVTWIADNPSYFLTDQTARHKIWIANVLYEATVEHLNFIPSSECEEVRFVTADEARSMNVFRSVAKFCDMFKPENHL